MENVRQSIDNLHNSITQDVLDMKRIVVDVIDPSPGLFGGDPVEGLVTIIYKCSYKPEPEFDNWMCKGCECTNHKQPTSGHAHHALYGPQDEITRPSWEVDTFSLYAD
jgi:hypothetical protein